MHSTNATGMDGAAQLILLLRSQVICIQSSQYSHILESKFRNSTGLLVLNHTNLGVGTECNDLEKWEALFQIASSQSQGDIWS